MKTSLPGVVVILGCGTGMMCGALLDHLSLGAFVGTSVGICIGLVLLLRRGKKPGS
jgi:hypothetical protein